ncbi:CDP-alcohol phosphatidyltransferase family protein [uncultured Bacteroides sp.]|uniref:CDP-alcohol phosphatidyltransferase family protein n=1 Tax=uncultured Bacteroides sp. TaxID=162156 RepID=UPI002AAA767E|nr:CDP-alcohol phosphatidyltransferase family protein [uncultured Bacteroides sp.]
MNIPNLITISRIILSIVLLTVIDSIPLFLSIFFIAGLSDVADGYIARRFNMTTVAGAKLDSIADIVFNIAILSVIYMKYRWVLSDNLLLFIIVIGIKLLSVIVSKIKFGKIMFLHTIANKITGMLLFIAVPCLMFKMSNCYIIVLLGMAIFAAVEELLILIKDDEIDLNRKSLFVK